MIKLIKKKIIRAIRKKMVDVALPPFRFNSKLNKFKETPESKIYSFGEKNPDKVFYVIRINFGGGLFAIVLYVLSEIKYAKSINAIPIVDMENFINKYNEGKKIKKTFNSWKYYFDDISKFTLDEIYDSKSVLINSGIPNERMPRHWKIDPDLYNNYFVKYIRINKEFIKMSDNFSKIHFKNKKVLGVHFRGKGMNNTPNHPFGPTPTQMFLKVDQYLSEKKFDKIFLVTDQKNYLELFKKRYGNKVCFCNTFRSNTIRAFHYKDARLNHRYKMGRNILLEMLLLSKLSALICSRSNVSQLASLISKNNNYEVFEIWNGMNSKKILLSLFLWNIKRILPEFLGGFKKKI